MGHNTTVEGSLTIPTRAVDAWAASAYSDATTDEARREELLTVLADRISESAIDPVTASTNPDGNVTAFLDGDWCSSYIEDTLTVLAEKGATGRVVFPDEGWGYELAANKVREIEAGQMWPDDQMLVLQVSAPGRDRHRAVYSTDHAVCRAIHALHAEWFGRNSTPADLDAALAALIAAGAEATCEALPFAA